MTPITISPERLEQFAGLSLKLGAHTSPDAGMCAMEAAAWLAGEPHSDKPACVCPTIAAVMRRWNDAADDAQRDSHIKPLVRMIAVKAENAA